MFIFIPLFNYRTLNSGIVINNLQELLDEMDKVLKARTHYWILDVNVDCFVFSLEVWSMKLFDVAHFRDG